ncbi:MAG: hypothetical protein KKF77_09365 [Proteobacteria bacterium]|nr:hypothetical protein [Pseudomonadota bacterium]
MKELIQIFVGVAGLLFFGAAFVKATFSWEKCQENMRKQGHDWPRPVALAACLAFIVGAGYLAVDGYTTYKATSPSSINSVEKAQKYVLGTWVYADPLDPKNLYVDWWQKWVVKDDSSIDVYVARPVDGSWGKPENMRYSVITNKYADTGERYYAIKVLGTAQFAIIQPDGTLSYSIMGNGAVPMRRGNKNPFSK